MKTPSKKKIGSEFWAVAACPLCDDPACVVLYRHDSSAACAHITTDDYRYTHGGEDFCAAVDAARRITRAVRAGECAAPAAVRAHFFL